MNKKNLRRVISICMFSFLLTGCAQQYPNLSLSEGDQKLVTNYAVGILMKYNAGSNMRVLSGAQLEIAQIEETARLEKEARRQQLADEYAAGKKNDENASQDSTITTVGSGGEVSESSVAAVSTIGDLGSFLSMPDYSITYQYYEILDSYVSTEDHSAMALEAGDGKRLLIAHFAVTNNGAEAAHLDVLSQDIDFRLVTGTKEVPAEFTLLLNDLSMYKGDVEAGSTLDTVLVFEVTDEEAAVGGLQILVSMGSSEGSINL